ncbi:hypothetical protein MKEN_01439700 [Mycena kentingensis (nom. inval.)]|nr:hypothetical protein MKEN_01439700 [Mycena kentingensis (nom. inval.)]
MSERNWPPSSSPPSSPQTTNLDSSPASSPRLDPLSIERDPVFQHPWAASAKGWIPPDCEKGSKTRLSTPPTRDQPPKKQRRFGPESMPLSPTPTPRQSIVREEDREAATWEDAASHMVDQASGVIDLDSRQLTEMPAKFIADLHAFFVPVDVPPSATRTFSRVKTAPAVIIGSSRVAGAEIFLWLAGNLLSSVPKELFLVERLTQLSLRNNRLQYLPPEIRFAKNLVFLNVGNNLLKYLPAEIDQLPNVQQLLLFPNPFWSLDALGGQSINGRLLSPITRSPSRVPSLVELCLRVLFGSDKPGARPSVDRSCRRIVKVYELPLLEDGITDKPLLPKKKRFTLPLPPMLRCKLDALHPDSVYAYDEDPRLSNVEKEPEEPGDRLLQLTPPPVRPCTHVAGLKAPDLVPLRWRGCATGCLAFLGPDKAEDQSAPSAEEEKDEVVQRVQVGGNLDFDDDA